MWVYVVSCSQTMFRRKLQALDYHSARDLDISNPQDLKVVVIWLEDQKIRHYKIDEREDLRNSTGQNWTTAFHKYLKNLECPHDPQTQLPAVFDWLLAVAIRYEYSEAAQTNPALKCGLEEQTTLSQPPAPQQSALDIDPQDQTFVSGVQALAKILKVCPHPDPAVLLEAVRIVIEEKLSPKTGDVVERKSRQFQVTPKDCGFELGDPVLGEAAKVLRLLHIHELRQLQTRINELIVNIQGITANPKTDQSLGKVGR